MRTSNKNAATVSWIALALVSGCADLLGVDFDRVERLDAGGPSAPPDAAASPTAPETRPLQPATTCAGGADCPSTAARCSANTCVVPADCAEIKQGDSIAPSGLYTIDPDGAAGLAPFPVWCDMVTDGGGWTIVTSMSGADNEEGLTSDVEASDSALSFQRANLSRAKKMALSALETESIFVRHDGRWLKANKPMFDNTLGTASKDAAIAVKLNGMNGATADGFMGWSNHDILGGGDFGISVAPDGVTSCATHTVSGFDHARLNSYDLNCNCDRQYLYSYSSNPADGDASYNVNTGLGGWTATTACTSNEGGGIVFYAAMRRPLAAYASCQAIKTALPATPSGWQLIDTDGAGEKPAVGVYCDMMTDGGGYTQLPVTGGTSSFKRGDPDSCAIAGMTIAIARTKAHQQSMYARWGPSYFMTVPGVSGTAAGNFTGCAMNSTDGTCAANWKATDNGAWFARDVPYSEPNGDYVPGCWLGVTGNDANGFIFFDGNCNYPTGANYVCSDNAK